MQKALNSLDQEKRKVNAMINGLPEGEMISDDGNHTVLLSNDLEKVHWILKIMDCNHFDHDKLKKLNISHLGTVNYNNPTFSHQKNPDTVINNNGGKLLKWSDERKYMILLNGLVYENKEFDSKFIFFQRCNKIFSNTLNSIDTFEILDKMIYSDHCPIVFSCTITPSIPLEFVYACSKGLFNYDHYDVNKRMRHPINMSRIDATTAVHNMNLLAAILNNLDTSTENTNDLQ